IGIAALALPAPGAFGQTSPDLRHYPARPVRVIVPTPAGGATDFTARAITQRLTESWGHQFIIDNRAGAGGILPQGIAARAVPDGYPLIISTASGLVTNPLATRAPYDAFRDFAPISLGTVNPQLLFVNPQVPAASVKELISLARARPRELNC